MKNQENFTRMPALFIGHGNPMNAITDNPYREAWLTLGKNLPKPKAILCISAHWQTRGTQVCAVEHPKTIHDFGGFPAELFAQQYPAPGAPEYAKLVCDLLPNKIKSTLDWDLDHGAWSILQSLFPNADVPVFQLSLDVDLNFSGHFKLAKKLASLRKMGIMIIGSGNIVHNLGRLNMQGKTPDWAITFDEYVKQALELENETDLLDIARAGDSASLSVPTDEHFLPLLYIAAVRHADDGMQFITESFDLGSLSMRSVIYQ
jgi:4,5-DOPA dioxygenase extradiol